MRKLMWFTIGVAAAIITGVYLLSGNWSLVMAGIFLAVFLAAHFLHWKLEVRAVLVGLIFGALWLWIFDISYLRPARMYDGTTAELQIEASDYSTFHNQRTGNSGKVRLDGRIYHVQIYVKDDAPQAPGDVLSGTFRLEYKYEGGIRPSEYYSGNGIFLVASSQTPVEIQQAEKTPVRYFGTEIRRYVQGLLHRIFPEDTFGFAQAILLGESGDLNYQDDVALQTSGIRHMIAVSGLHISILFSTVYVLCGKKRWLTAAIGFPTLLLFASVVGFTPSVVRACVMQGILLLAMLSNREYDGPTALSFAVLVMLIVNPVVIASVSFQLSVGCLIGLYLLSGRIQQYITKKLPAKPGTLRAKLVYWFAGSVSASLSALIITMPLCAWHFRMISLVGVFTNLLTIWIVPWVFGGGILACLFGMIWTPAGQALAWVVSWGIRYILLVARLIAAVPAAAISTDNVYLTAWRILCYILIGAFITAKKKRPAQLALCIAVSLAASMLCHFVEFRTDHFRVTVLDVGQGQCVILQTQEETYIVDFGGDSGKTAADRACRFLQSLGIYSVDGLIITHFDSDHVDGANYLMERLATQKLYVPDVADGGSYQEELIQNFPEAYFPVQETTGLTLSDGSLTIYPAAPGNTGNNSSLCILFQIRGFDILITGDRNTAGEEELLQMADIPDLEVLIVGHHGSKSSTGLQLLSQTHPEVAVISVGEDNGYGHPTWEALERLKLFGCKVWRTDQDRTVILRG